MPIQLESPVVCPDFTSLISIESVRGMRLAPFSGIERGCRRVGSRPEEGER